MHLEAWKLGLKAVAIYRDNCKVAQPLSTTKKEADAAVAALTAAVIAPGTPTEVVTQIVERIIREPVRQKLPRTRRVAHVRVPRRGLQGVRHGRRVRRRSSGRDLPTGLEAGFDPRRHHGRLRHLDQPRPAVRRAAAGVRRGVHEHAVRAGGHDRRSRHPLRELLMDYLFRRLALEYLSYDERAELGIMSVGERLQPTLPGVEETVVETTQGFDVIPDPKTIPSASELATQIELGLAPRRRSPGRSRSRPPRRRRRQRRRRGERRAELHAVRGADEPGRQLLRLPELRQHQRLLITADSAAIGIPARQVKGDQSRRTAGRGSMVRRQPGRRRRHAHHRAACAPVAAVQRVARRGRDRRSRRGHRARARARCATSWNASSVGRCSP